jgi:hypothetical protein
MGLRFGQIEDLAALVKLACTGTARGMVHPVANDADDVHAAFFKREAAQALGLASDVCPTSSVL